MEQNEEMKDQKNKDSKGLSTEGEQNIDDVPMFKRKGVIIPFIIILIAAIGGIYWYIGQLGYISTDDAYIDGNQLSVSTKILGRITKLTVDEGDTVKTGQLLVKLDSTDLMAQENQAKAMVELANESIKLAQVNVAKAQDDFNRAQKQYNDKVIPKEKFDHAQKAFEVSKAELNIDKTKIGTAEAQLNVVKTELNNTNIYSPMDGVVGKRWVLKGDVVQPGQPIFTIFDMKNIWVTADLEETKLTNIHIGDKVQIFVDTYPNQNFEGKIFQIGSNTASEFSLIPPANASGNFTKVTQRIPIKISIEHISSNGQQSKSDPIQLLQGMSVEIKINVK